jgi:hypothetical protein
LLAITSWLPIGQPFIGTQLEVSPPQNAIDCAMLSRISRNREIPILFSYAYTKPSNHADKTSKEVAFPCRILREPSTAAKECP